MVQPLLPFDDGGTADDASFVEADADVTWPGAGHMEVLRASPRTTRAAGDAVATCVPRAPHPHTASHVHPQPRCDVRPLQPHTRIGPLS